MWLIDGEAEVDTRAAGGVGRRSGYQAGNALTFTCRCRLPEEVTIANVKKGTLVPSGEPVKNFKLWGKRTFHKKQRAAVAKEIETYDESTTEDRDENTPKDRDDVEYEGTYYDEYADVEYENIWDDG